MEKNINDYILEAEAENRDIDIKGGNRLCFLFDGYALLKGYYNEEKLKLLIERTKKLKEKRS